MDPRNARRTPPFPVRVLPQFALRAWFTPPPRSGSAATRDADALAGFDRIDVSLPDGDSLDGYAIGDGPFVLALHGWGGRAAQMSDIARRLADEGFRVVTLDLPGRAGSPMVDIKMVASAIQGAIDVLGTPVAVIGHSFAGLAMRLLPWDHVPAAVVLVAPVVRVSDALAVFAQRMRLLPWTRQALFRRLRDWDPDLFELIDQPYPQQFPGADLLVLHDPADPDTSFSSAAELAVLRPRTQLLPTPGTGHNGLLRDAATLDRITGFVTQTVSPHTGLQGRVASGS